MATFPESLRTFIVGSTAVNTLVDGRCHYNHIPQSMGLERIWFRVSSDTEERTLDKVGGLHECYTDIECAAATESEAQALADAVKARLDGYAGTFGSTGSLHTAQGFFLRDKDDDYIPRLNESDQGVHVVSYELHAFYTT